MNRRIYVDISIVKKGDLLCYHPHRANGAVSPREVTVQLAEATACLNSIFRFPRWRALEHPGSAKPALWGEAIRKLDKAIVIAIIHMTAYS